MVLPGWGGDRRGFAARAGLCGRGLAGIAGDGRRAPAASCGMCAGCIHCLICEQSSGWGDGRRSGGVAERRCLGGGCEVAAAFAEAVALAFERDHGDVVDEPVDRGGGDHGVAEDRAPLLEAAVTGDDDRAALVAAGEIVSIQDRSTACTAGAPTIGGSSSGSSTGKKRNAAV